MGKTDNLVVGFDLGGTKMLAVVFNGDHEVLGSHRERTPAESKAETIFGCISQCVVDAVKDAGVSLEAIQGIGVGSPGPLDPFEGVIIDTPNMGFRNFPLRARLSKALGRPAWVDNDVNMGTYGEFLYGAGRGYRHVVGLFPGTGVGGGIIIDGKVYRGLSGAAGEVGHMVIGVDGPLCGCGHYGCLEAYISRPALAKDAAALASRGQAPTVLERAGTDVTEIRSKVLARAMKAGDREIERLVLRSARYLGIGMANLVQILNPEVMILGGGLVEALPAEYYDEALKTMRAYSPAWMIKNMKVAKAQLGDLAVAMGAAQLVRDNLKPAGEAK